MTFYLWTFITTSFHPQKETVVLMFDNRGIPIDLISFNFGTNHLMTKTVVISVEKLGTWYE